MERAGEGIPSRQANSFFSSFFRILPLALRGRVSGQNTISTGTLKAASRSRDEGAQLVLAWPSAPGFSVHHRAGLLAQRLVRDADHGGVHHGGVVVEDVLDLDAVDVLAAADQHVLGPVDDEEKPSSSIRARSPVRTQPSTKVSAVASGLFQ